MSKEIREKYGLYVPFWDEKPEKVCNAEGPGRKRCVRAADHTDVDRYAHHRHVTWDPSYGDWEPTWDWMELYGFDRSMEMLASSTIPGTPTVEEYLNGLTKNKEERLRVEELSEQVVDGGEEASPFVHVPTDNYFPCG